MTREARNRGKKRGGEIVAKSNVEVKLLSALQESVKRN